MARLDEVLADLDSLKEYVVTIDAGVELLFKQIEEIQSGDISEAAKAALLAKAAEIRAAADKVLIKDEPPVEG